MVDLNRQISVTRAQQGGFSAHILPGAVEYAATPQYMFRPLKVGSDWIFESTTGSNITAAVSGSTPALAATIETAAPPYSGATYFNAAATSSQASFVKFKTPTVGLIAAPSLETGFTLEGWFKQLQTKTSFGDQLVAQTIRLEEGDAGNAANFTFQIRSGGDTSFPFEDLKVSVFPRGTGSFSELTEEFSTGSVTQWKHYAAVFLGGTVKVYVQGSLIQSASGISQSLPLSNMTQIRYECETQISGTTIDWETQSHMIRYTSSALYDGSFTPPQF